MDQYRSEANVSNSVPIGIFPAFPYSPKVSQRKIDHSEISNISFKNWRDGSNTYKAIMIFCRLLSLPKYHPDFLVIISIF